MKNHPSRFATPLHISLQQETNKNPESSSSPPKQAYNTFSKRLTKSRECNNGNKYNLNNIGMNNYPQSSLFSENSKIESNDYLKERKRKLDNELLVWSKIPKFRQLLTKKITEINYMKYIVRIYKILESI